MTPRASSWTRRLRLDQKYIPALATIVLFLVTYGAGSIRYEGFSDTQVFLNIFINKSFLMVVAVGMTFVILTGGIDLSVGSVVGLGTMLSAWLLERQHWPAPLALPTVLLAGAALGFAMGCVIHYFNIQPFIVTLAGLFLARGLCFAIDTEAIPINNEFWRSMAQTRIRFGNYHISPSVVIALIVVAVAAYVLAYTRFGRGTYAIGGDEQSALLMGLPVKRTKIAVYTISGFCAALGGVLMSFYTQSGYSLHAEGMELEAIAAVVIGGTILTGGSGYVIGSVFGVLVLGIIQTIITFQGTLSSWWTKMVSGVLLFVFILLQRVVGIRRTASPGG